MNQNITIASGPVIIEEGKILVNRHGETKEAQSIWKFAGGRVSDNDLTDTENVLENACIRKAKEEMGIEIEILAPLKPMLVQRPDAPGLSAVLIHYLAKRKGEINPSPKIVEWRWFNIDKLPKNCAPNIKPVIKSYKELVANKYRISNSAISSL